MSKLSFAPACLSVIALSALVGCAGTMHAEPRVDNAALPDAVRVPAGQAQSLYTTGTGEITYECREKKAGGGHEWAFVAPAAAGPAHPGRGRGGEEGRELHPAPQAGRRGGPRPALRRRAGGPQAGRALPRRLRLLQARHVMPPPAVTGGGRT